MATEYVTETHTAQHTTMTAKICDKCGRRVPADCPLVHNFGAFFGFSSEFEGAVWSFDICETCLLDFVATFQQAPAGFDEELFGNWADARRNEIEIGGE